MIPHAQLVAAGVDLGAAAANQREGGVISGLPRRARAWDVPILILLFFSAAQFLLLVSSSTLYLVCRSDVDRWRRVPR